VESKTKLLSSEQSMPKYIITIFPHQKESEAWHLLVHIPLDSIKTGGDDATREGGETGTRTVSAGHSGRE
jgi:hypothetical protein